MFNAFSLRYEGLVYRVRRAGCAVIFKLCSNFRCMRGIPEYLIRLPGGVKSQRRTAPAPLQYEVKWEVFFFFFITLKPRAE